MLLDLDGTLYVGSQVVPGAPEAVRWLRDQGLAVRFCTNTDSVTPAALADRLAGRGFPVAEDELVTPVAVAARLLAAAPEARVLAVAAGGVRRLLGDRLAGPGEAVTHVLVADPSYGATYDDLDAAFQAVRGGAELLATQVNRVAIRDDGEHLDTGGLGAAAGVRHRGDGPGAGQAVAGVPDRAPGRPRPRTGHRAGRRGQRRVRHRRRAGRRRRHGAGPHRQGRPRPGAPGPSRTRSSTASPTCPGCSGAEEDPGLGPFAVTHCAPYTPVDVLVRRFTNGRGRWEAR